MSEKSQMCVMHLMNYIHLYASCIDSLGLERKVLMSGTFHASTFAWFYVITTCVAYYLSPPGLHFAYLIEAE